jgi:eukaryotic-like serine/threonine-protein kinase
MSGDLICPHGRVRPAANAVPPDCPFCGKIAADRTYGSFPTGASPVAPSGLTLRLRNPHTIVPATRYTEQTPTPEDSEAPAALWPDLPGYEILAELGRGGMGVVYKARQKGLNRVVALKMIVANTTASPDLLTRFRGEAETIARLKQPNIIQVYDINASASGPYFAMEYAEGGSLAEYWAGVAQPSRSAAQTVAALAFAVQAAHEQGIIHRDLKPANILLARVSGSQNSAKSGKRQASDGERFSARDLVPKISDFGLALRLDDPHGLTVPGQVMGTPGYMAPEQARGRNENVGPAVDIYALGVLLYEALTGRPPYRGVSGMESVHLMLSEEPLPPSRLRPDLPRDLETICLHCLHKEPYKRYATAGQLAEDLERFLAGEPIRARPTRPWERAWKWSRRHPATAGLAVALVLTIGVAFALVFSQWRRAEVERDLTDRARLQAVNLADAEARARHDAQVVSANLLLERGVSLCEAGECGPGLLWLARALETAPADETGLIQSTRLLMGGWGRQLRLPLRVFRHERAVEKVALSPDGNSFAAATGNLAYLWRADGSQPYGMPLVHGGPITDLAFSPDKNLVVTASKDGTARLWDATSGQPRSDPLVLGGSVEIALFSSDGKIVFTAGTAGNGRVWDTASGRASGAILRHGATILAAALSPDGRLIVTGGADGIARIWETATGGTPIRVLSHESPPSVVAFSPDGRTLVTGSAEGQVRFWDVATGHLNYRLTEHKARVCALVFSPDGKILATGSDDTKAILWDADRGTPRVRLSHNESVRNVVFSPGGKALATGSLDSTARMWSVETGRMLGAPLPHHGDVNSVLFRPDGRTLLTAADDGMVRLWPTEPPGTPDAVLPIGERIHGLSVSPDNQLVLIGDENGVTHLWDLKSQNHRVTAAGTRASNAVFGPDGKIFLTAGCDSVVRFWDAVTGKPTGRPLEHRAVVLAATFSASGDLVATGCDDADTAVRIWDRGRGTLLRTLAGHTRKVVSVAFSPDGKYLVSGSWDKTARVWNVSDGAPVGEPLQHQDLVQSVAFAPDSKAVLTGGDDYSARLWNAFTGQPLGPPLRHQEKIEAVAVSADGTTLLTSGHDGSAKLWDRATGKLLGPPVPYRGGLASAVFSPDGRGILTGGREGVVWRWLVPAAIERDPASVWLWLHAYTGLRLDAGGAIVPLEPNAWHEAFLGWRRLK